MMVDNVLAMAGEARQKAVAQFPESEK